MPQLLELGYKFTQRALQFRDSRRSSCSIRLLWSATAYSVLSCAPGHRREGIESMVLARFLAVVLVGGAALPLLLDVCNVAEADGDVGVSYGRVANDLPPDQASVVDLLRRSAITKVRIYDANPDFLRSLANTGIKLMVSLPNEQLASVASSPPFARQWVQDNVAAFYPTTRINGVAVGNEVFDSRPDLNSDLVRAMVNVQSALAQQGLDDAIKVSTPIALDALEVSWPPSKGRFRDEIAQPLLQRPSSPPVQKCHHRRFWVVLDLNRW